MRLRARPGHLVAMLAAACQADGTPVMPIPDAGSAGRSLVVVAAGDGVPIEGAVVVLESSASRREDVAGPDGRVVFEGVEFEGGPVSVTGVAQGFRVISHVAIDENQDAVELRMTLLPVQLETATVLGAILGMADVSNNVNVSATVPGVPYRHYKGANYGIEVATGQPMTLVASETEDLGPTEWGEIREVLQWATLEHAAVKMTPPDVDIDFAANAAESRLFGGTMTMPANPETRFRRTDDWSVFGGVHVGAPGLPVRLAETAWIEPSLDGTRATYEGEYVMLEDFQAVTTYVMGAELSSGTAGWWSFVAAHGYPADGVAVEFLDAPEVTSAVELHPLHDPITWTSYDASTEIILRISTGTGRIWDVIAPGDAESLTVPSLPSTVDEDKLLGAGPLEGRVVLCEADDSLGCRRSAESQAIELVP